MSKEALLYARVSHEAQNTEDRVSIDQQLAEMRALCERNGWRIAGEFVDAANYTATESPKKGKVVNPSGERADRPKFLEMLEVVRAGTSDVVLCWRDDRLVRHPRVCVALEDALDAGDVGRNGKAKIQVYDATGAVIDRFTLSIKATIWREENKRRAERVRLGKVGTLKEGRYPGPYRRFGYADRREEKRRGHVIELCEEEAEIVKLIFDLCDSGLSLRLIRNRLIAIQAKQRSDNVSRGWRVPFIRRILRTRDYVGEATWRFSDGTEYTIEIPQIVPPDQWDRVQKRLDRNRKIATRNAKGVYLLQNIVRCGECGGSVSAYAVNYDHNRRDDGTMHRRKLPIPEHNYRCIRAVNHYDEEHPRPHHWWGRTLDLAVWVYLVENVIQHPEAIEAQVLDHQSKLQAEGESIDGEIARTKQQLAKINEARMFYHRQAGFGRITEEDYEGLLRESDGQRDEVQLELQRLRELRDDMQKVRAGLDYAAEFMQKLQEMLPEINQPWDELKEMTEEDRTSILRSRQDIVRSLAQTVFVYSDGRVRIEGLFDGSEAAQFEYRTHCNGTGRWTRQRR